MNSQMLLEIGSQATAWRQASKIVRANANEVAAMLKGKHTRIIGAGSSYYLGNIVASAWAEQGLSASSVPASEPLLHPRRYRWGSDYVALAVSRSGTTSETLAALRNAKAAGAAAIVISTVPNSPMVEMADLALIVTEGAERATVQTRSFSSQLMTALALAPVTGDGRDLGALEHWLAGNPDLITRSAEFAHRVGTEWDRAYFLGTGSFVGLAQEGALKMKESALAEAEAFQTLEFRHGPKSMVDSRTLIVGLLSEQAQHQETKVLEEMRELGGRVIQVGEAPPDLRGIATFALGSRVPETLSAPLMLPVLHYLAYNKALSKGISPEHPRNLSFAVELSDL